MPYWKAREQTHAQAGGPEVLPRHLYCHRIAVTITTLLKLLTPKYHGNLETQKNKNPQRKPLASLEDMHVLTLINTPFNSKRKHLLGAIMCWALVEVRGLDEPTVTVTRTLQGHSSPAPPFPTQGFNQVTFWLYGKVNYCYNPIIQLTQPLMNSID